MTFLIYLIVLTTAVIAQVRNPHLTEALAAVCEPKVCLQKVYCRIKSISNV